MFERAFQWTVRNGSRALFALSVILILLGTLLDAWNVTHESYDEVEIMLALISGFVGSLRLAMLPLVAAIAIEHFRAHR